MKRILLLLTFAAALFISTATLTPDVAAQESRASTVRYRITFDANWSPDIHPHSNFPGNDHWSALVGTMHKDTMHLWQIGELATPGIKNVAEFGSNSALNNEVNAAIVAGNADQWIQQGFPDFSGDTTAIVEITASSDFPLLSLATMVAPSPDWFSGIDSLSLYDADGGWVISQTVNVYPFDAGTDSGTLYTSGDQATVPFQPIADYTGVMPFANAPIGVLTVEQISAPTAVALSAAQVTPAPASTLIVAAGLMLGLLGLTVVRRTAGTR